MFDEDFAKRLREDESLIDAGKDCSWTAWHLPKYDKDKGKAIASHLAPFPGLSHDIKRIIYENLLNKIIRYLNPGINPVPSARLRGIEQAHGLLPSSELVTALRVIEHFQETAVITEDTPVSTILALIKQQLNIDSSTDQVLDDQTSSNIPIPPPMPQRRLCYICRLTIGNHYPTHPSLCILCGAFNYASSSLSMPPKLNLSSDFTALVTGAGLNLGYHTALRLLRCGARVIATKRYPRDAVARYLYEEDSDKWKERLKVVGADFRSAADVFALVHETKKCLAARADGKVTKLDALINYAAQTLTNSVEEGRAVRQEEKLHQDMGSSELLIQGAYTARIRGGTLPSALGFASVSITPSPDPQANIFTTSPEPIRANDSTPPSALEPHTKSSWVQSLHEIPYEDIISAHSVNSFCPLILIRELLPLMGCAKSPPSPALTRPQGYIVNVSSREGIFENRADSAAKAGKHVHTNMSKAALNMITEIEVATAWQSRRMAMNTVDPGYMSAAPEYEDAFGGVRPIGWEDGAGRVLWPLAVGEIEGKAVWGRFLKHYGVVGVDPGVGRG